MPVSASTTKFLETLDAFSGHTLTHREDLGTLVELSSLHGRKDLLNRLSFLAKFVCRVYGIMKRIGKDDEGYTTLEQEFSKNLEEAIALTRTLIGMASQDERQRFEAAYFSMTQAGLHNLLALFRDVAWYKNWLIDHGGEEV